VTTRSYAAGALSLAALSILIARSIAPPPGGPVRLLVQAQAAQRDVARIGINLGTWTSWGAEQLSSNVLMNPGFETTIDRALVIVSHADGRSFEDDRSWLARPDGFWRGAHYEVRNGADAGRRGVITDSKSAGPDGMPQYQADPAPSDLAQGDVVEITLENEPGPPANWWIGRSSIAQVTLDMTQHRPGSPGTSALSLSLGAAGPTAVSSYLDAITNRAGKLLLVKGPWRLRFWSRFDAGSKFAGSTTATLRVTFGRIGSAPFVDRTIEPSSQWQLTSIEFAGRDNQAPAATLELRFSASGTPPACVLLDDVDLRALSSASTAFRSEVIAALRLLHPGYLRDWQGQLGDTLMNRLTPDFGRHPSRYRPGEETQFGYSLPDFLDLCARVGARPWVVVPTTFSDAELIGLGKFLAAENDSRRFDRIALEFGNENWNGIFRPAGIPNPETYGLVADRAFRLIREGAGSAPWRTMVVGGQYTNPDLSARVAGHAPGADTLAIGPYFLYSLAAGLQNKQRLAALFEDSGDNLQTIGREAARLGKSLAVYEVNLHTIGGDAPDSERNPLIAGAAAGGVLARRIIQSLNAGAAFQCAYVLAGFDAATAVRGGFARLWGVTRDLAGAPRLRPTGLAIALINRVMGGDFHPVWTADASVSAAAFLNRFQWSVVVASATDQPLTVRIEFPARPSARLPSQLLRLVSRSPFSTNEDQRLVSIAQSETAPEGRTISVALAPYGLAVLAAPDLQGKKP
jgi:hypothetical protein